jgi:hypothetical protein
MIRREFITLLGKIASWLSDWLSEMGHLAPIIEGCVWRSHPAKS